MVLLRIPVTSDIKLLKNFLVQSCNQSDYHAVKTHLYSIAIKKGRGNEIMKIEKIFLLVFFGCLFISSLTFLAYDHVNEEIKKYIIWVNILFFIIVLVMILYAKLILKK